MLYDLGAISWVAAAATAGVAVGYNYARRKYDNARRGPRATRSPTILPLRHNSSGRSSFPPAVPSEVKEEQREESAESLSSQETVADVTEPGTLKRKSREFDAENSTKVSVGVNTDEPPRKKSRTPPVEAQPELSEQVLQEADAFLADILSNPPPSIASEVKSGPREVIAEADVSMSDEVYEPLIEPATLIATGRTDFALQSSSPLAAPVIRTKPLPEFTTPPATSLRSSPSPSAAETAPTAPSTVLPPFASNVFDTYSTMSGSPFSTASKPAFAASSTTTTSSACFSRFDSYVNTTTSTSTSFSALASRPSVFGGSGKTNATPRAYTFAETKPSTSSVFSGFASTPESFMPAAKPSPPQPLQQVALDGDVDEEVDELAEETEPVGDGALTSVTPNIEEAPVNTGEEREVVLMAVYNASLHTWRDGKWTISAVPVNARWLRDIVDDTERIVCRQSTGTNAVRMNVALGDLPTSAKIAVQPKVRDRVKNVHSLLIDTVEHVTGPDGIVKPKAVKYWLKCGSGSSAGFEEFVMNVRESTQLPKRTAEEERIEDAERAEELRTAAALRDFQPVI